MMDTIARRRKQPKADMLRELSYVAALSMRSLRFVCIPNRVFDLINDLEREQQTLRTKRQRPSDIAHCAGLPVSDFRNVFAQVDKARREIAAARGQMVKGHLRLVASIGKNSA